MIESLAYHYRLARLLIRETVGGVGLERRPEPDLIMGDEDNVQSFHSQGESDSALAPIYQFNALGTSRLVPENGKVLDLGTGSAKYITHLASLRKDIHITGVDLSEEMIRKGNEEVKKAGLEDRVTLVEGDMTDFAHLVSPDTHVISSIFSFHHLLAKADLIKCLTELSNAQKRYGCSIWTFDHVRPKKEQTAFEFPDIFTPDAPVQFKQDSTNSLIASFSFPGLSRRFDRLFDGNILHACSKLMHLYQVHMVESDILPPRHSGLASEMPMSEPVKKNYERFRWMFNSVPIDASGR